MSSSSRLRGMAAGVTFVALLAPTNAAADELSAPIDRVTVLRAAVGANPGIRASEQRAHAISLAAGDEYVDHSLARIAGHLYPESRANARVSKFLGDFLRRVFQHHFAQRRRRKNRHHQRDRNPDEHQFRQLIVQQQSKSNR